MKKIALVLLVLLIAAVLAVYHYRDEIFRLSADVIIRKTLPDYISVENVVLDMERSTLELEGLYIKNPRGYRNRYFAEIASIKCGFQKKGETILDGIEITGILCDGVRINIERLRDNRLNVNEMGEVMKTSSSKPGEPAGGGQREDAKSNPIKERFLARNKIKLEDFIKLPETININNGKLLFFDEAVGAKPYLLIFEKIESEVGLQLSHDLKDVLRVSSRGRGIIDGSDSQTVEWVVSIDPKEKELTMSNRYEVRDVDITLFAPYYSEYSPIEVKKGRFSGSMVIDFDHGNIGSTNKLILKDVEFTEKKEGMSGFWQTDMLPQIIDYLRSSSGEIIFDFKIKGEMSRPVFFPGPHVKKAIQNAVVDKIMGAVGGEEQGGTDSGQGSSDAEKVIDLLRGMMQK